MINKGPCVYLLPPVPYALLGTLWSPLVPFLARACEWFCKAKEKLYGTVWGDWDTISPDSSNKMRPQGQGSGLLSSITGRAGNKGPTHRPFRGSRQLAHSARQPCQRPQSKVYFTGLSLGEVPQCSWPPKGRGIKLGASGDLG